MKPLPDLRRRVHGGQQSREEGSPELAEEGSYHHVQFLGDGALLADRDEPLDDDPDDEHFDGKEGEVDQHVEDEVAAVAEDEVVDEIERRRRPRPARRLRAAESAGLRGSGTSRTIAHR